LKNTAKPDKSMMTKSKSSEMLSKMREEKAWLIKVRLESCKVFSTRESKMPMNRQKKCKITMKRVIGMNKKLSSSEIKSKRKEEKVRLMKEQLKSYSTFSQKNSESSKIINSVKQPWRLKLLIWEIKSKNKETKV